MFLQQTFVALGRALPAVIAPAILTDLRIDAVWVGVYFGLTAAASLVALLANCVSRCVAVTVAPGTAAPW